MNGKMLCVDAGMVVRRVLFPQDTTVQSLWESWENEGCQVIAPHLIFYEVTNALYRYQRQGWLSRGTVAIALEAALALPIELDGDANLHRRARVLAAQFNLSAAYDAHYLALAERLGVDFWTADQRLTNALHSYKLTWVRSPIPDL